MVDPRPADPDLHRRQLRPRLQRRAEGHGSHHADPDRHGADGLCAQPRHAARRAGVRRPGDGRAAARSTSMRAGPRAGRSARRASTRLRAHAQVERRGRCRRWPRSRAASPTRCEPTARSRKMPADDRHQHPQRHVPDVRGRCASSARTRIQASTPRRRATSAAFKKEIDGATKFIPLWVKVAVAIALGLGTMVGWKRIVVTVGEKIGKTHLTYAQGASAELVGDEHHRGRGHVRAAGLAPPTCCPPASPAPWPPTTRGCSGDAAQPRVAWVLTLPAAIVISGCLYWMFSHVF